MNRPLPDGDRSSGGKAYFRIWLLFFLLTACQGSPPAPTATPPGLINWERSPQTVVFRADVIGDEPEISALNEIPPCTVYGDNRVVWTNELGAFETQVLWDQVTDEAIATFVQYLSVAERFYTYEAGASLQPPSAVRLLVDTLTLNINGQTHTADSFSGWESGYFQRILTACRNISQTPVLYQPDAAWLTAASALYDPAAPVSLWNAEASGLSLAEVAAAGHPRWIEGQNVPILSSLIHTSPPALRLIENGVYYQVALQIPGITRTAP